MHHLFVQDSSTSNNQVTALTFIHVHATQLYKTTT